MAIKIRTDIFAMNAIRGLSKSSKELSDIYSKLSSGIRINKASDDAAGLAIASSLNTDCRVFNQGLKNVNDGISFIQIASNAISSLKDITIRRQELAEQSANGVYSDKQRESLNEEFIALANEYQRIIATTEFNGLNLLNGSMEKLSLQLGYSELDLDFGKTLKELKTLGVYKVGYSAERSFTQTVASTNGGFSSDIALGDVNGDGFLDMIVSDYGTKEQCTNGGYSNTVSVSIGKGDGTFEDAVFYSLGVESRPHNVSLADINSDGHLDILSDIAQGDVVYLMTNNGDGTFNTSETFDPELIVLNSVASGDINGDGNVDIITAGRGASGNGVFVNLGDGAGNFSAATTGQSTPSSVFNLRVADINGDGNDDVVSANKANNSFSVFTSNGTGLEAGDVYNVGATVYDVAVGDLDGDGKSDIAVASGNGLHIYKQNEDGTFSNVKTFNEGSRVTAVEIDDIDNDGSLDVVSAQSLDNTVTLFINEGDLKFKKQTAYAGSGASAMAVGDINNDDALDVATANSRAATAEALTAGEVHMDILTQRNALNSLDELKTILEKLSSFQGQLGAVQSRLETASNVMQISKENSSAAASIISDVDVADASSRMVRQNILQEVSASIISHANLQSNIALQLLDFSNETKK